MICSIMPALLDRFVQRQFSRLVSFGIHGTRQNSPGFLFDLRKTAPFGFPSIESFKMEKDDKTLELFEKVETLSAKLSDLDRRTQEVFRENSFYFRQNLLFFSRPIGFINSAYPSKNGTPRQGSLCANVSASLTIKKNVFTNAEHALDGLKEFTHVWLIFWFHLNTENSAKAKVKPPRLGGLSSKGVFATRSPHRPNPLGLSLVRLEQIDGDTLFFTGVDLVDGTPVLDIKPFVEAYDAPGPPDEEKADEDTSTWVTRADESEERLDNLIFTPKALDNLKKFHNRCENECERCLHFIDESLLSSTLKDLLISDLRSGYRKNHCSDRIHFITIDSMKFSVWYDDEGGVYVLNVTPRDLESANEAKPESDTDEITTKLTAL